MHRFRTLAVLPLAAGILTACTDTVDTPVAVSPDGTRISATILTPPITCTGNVLTVADGDTLSGQVNISAGCTFIVSPTDLNAYGKVTIYGDASVSPSALVISQGAKIRAVGSANVPIVFTPTGGSPAPGDWGGIVLIGSAQTNDATATVEGIPGGVTYGGANDTSSIGDMRYVRIEFAGYQLLVNNELNGLSMYGVGCNPADTLEYIQVYRGSDHGFEFFGGCADLRYAVATGNEDDSFDYSFGWRGRGQFSIALQAKNGCGDKGIEADSGGTGTTGTPRTNPYLLNLTLVGRDTALLANRQIPDSTMVHAGNGGIQLRRQVQSTIRSSVVMGFDEACNSSGASTHLVDRSIFFGKSATTAACTTTAGTLRAGAPGLYRPLARADTADFRPTPGSSATTGAYSPVPTTHPAGITGATASWFTQTSYVGAAPVRSGATAWYAGWTNWNF